MSWLMDILHSNKLEIAKWTLRAKRAETRAHDLQHQLDAEHAACELAEAELKIRKEREQT